jgi:cell division protease FtsH
VRKRPPHNTFTAFGKRTPSDRPPVEIPTSLRKPSPNGNPNGSNSNGSGHAQPGIVPEPAAPEPPAPGGGVFGPGPYGQPPHSAE